MQGRKTYTPKLFNNFNLMEAVPEDNFYRRLNQALDLYFLYPATRNLYGGTGNPSIDPVVFFKLNLIGYLENIVYDRQLMRFCSLRLDILLFLGYNIDEPLPNHSCISRTRQLYPDAVFEKMFNRVFSMCAEAGMVKGEVQATDSALVKANASLESLERLEQKHPEESLGDHTSKVKKLNAQAVKKTKTGTGTAKQRRLDPTKKELPTQEDINEQKPMGQGEAEDESAEQHKDKETEKPNNQPQSSKTDNEQKQLEDPGEPQDEPVEKVKKSKKSNNKTHRSKTDPDSRMAVKPGKACKMNYMSSMSVDTANHVITHIQADFADKKDSQCYQDIITRTKDRLAANDLAMKVSLADTNYSSGENYQFIDQLQLDGYIPVHGKYQKEREGFIYDQENDRWTCGNGKYLSFHKLHTTKEGYKKKQYRSQASDCLDCPLKEQCFSMGKQKQLEVSAYKPEYDKMIEKVDSGMGVAMRRKRHSTVEPVFGSLINYTGMSKINVRGMSGANKTMLMAATAYNLKKWMKFTAKKVQTGAVALKNGSTNLLNGLLKPILDLFETPSNPEPILRW